ncbi:hypothetical protein [Halodesulfovibrio aestuarii]|uniref:Uncharacterized protein n=1 Tax=Halodesulfovibrio aestuarii TaxID=126333 RepID=A0ABV4JMX9_9BACT
MVKIPTASRQSQLSDAPVTNLQQGVAFGQGIAALGQVVQQIGEKEQVRRDNDQFLAARTKYDAWNLEFETQAEKRKGEAAEGLTRDYEQAEQETWSKLFFGLSPRAAKALEQYRGGQLGSKKKLHAFAEHQGQLTVAKNNFAGSMAVLKQEMLDSPYDIDTHLTKAQQNFDLAVSSGAVLPSQREVFNVELEGMKKTAWQALFDRAPAEALKQTEKYGINDSMKAVYAEKHKDKVTSTQSLAITNELAGNGKSLKENLDYAHKKYADNPELHDKVVQRLTLRRAQEESALALQQKEQKETLFSQVAEAGQDADAIQRIIFSAPIALRDDLRKMGERQLTPNKDVITNPKALLEAEEYIFNGTISSELQLRMGYYMKLNDTDYDRLKKQLVGKRKGEIPSLTEGEINRYLAEFEIYKDMESPKGMKQYNFARDFVRTYFERENPTTRDEKNVVLANALKELLQKGRAEDAGFAWFDKDETYLDARINGHDNWRMVVPEEHKSNLKQTAMMVGFKAHTGEEERLFYETWRPVYEVVPRADLVKIMQGLKKHNKTANRPKLITPQSVLNVYRTKRG